MEHPDGYKLENRHANGTYAVLISTDGVATLESILHVIIHGNSTVTCMAPGTPGIMKNITILLLGGKYYTHDTTIGVMHVYRSNNYFRKHQLL